ncbi:MAG: hypothetical protein J6S85_06650 [Methanobrevibacter sp.]|nr:hypothetical protein [Methanobrevibacter sp.]
MSFDLFGQIGIKDSQYSLMVPTGTLLDLITGTFVPGENGSVICDGGIAPTNGIHGPPGSFKSTVSDGFVVNALERFPGSQWINYDTEQSKRDKYRLLDMSSLHRENPQKRKTHLEDLDKRIRIVNLSDYAYLEDFMEIVDKVYQEKMKRLKDYTVETPISDKYSDNNRRMILPTFITIDSYSKAVIKTVDAIISKSGESSSDANMTAAKEALIKNRFLRKLPKMAERAGIYFVMTAQNAAKMAMDGGPPKKVTQYMSQGDTIKGVGSDFLFLIQSDFDMRTPRLCQDSNKNCDYPYPTGLTSPSEMSEVTFTVNRCKNHGAGLKFTPVVSQTNGYEPNITNYNYLRVNGYFGLGTDKTRPRPALLPDQFFMRTTAYEKLTDPKMARAVEILAQLYLVQASWTIMDKEVPFDITPQKLHEFLQKSGYAQDDILASRGWWTYKGTEWDKVPYLSLYDILALACGKYKPKWK